MDDYWHWAYDPFLRVTIYLRTNHQHSTLTYQEKTIEDFGSISLSYQNLSKRLGRFYNEIFFFLSLKHPGFNLCLIGRLQKPWCTSSEFLLELRIEMNEVIMLIYFKKTSYFIWTYSFNPVNPNCCPQNKTGWDQGKAWLSITT